MRKVIFSGLVLLFLLSDHSLFSQVRSLDDFETQSGWSFNQSDGVNLHLSSEKGLSGNAIRFDYDFTKGTGYGGIQKWFALDLPENFEFTFYLRAESPSNNFEIKFIDSTGNNVWWVNNRNFNFPHEWKKIRVKKRHIGFAWGPATDHSLKRIDRIEFTIASFVGGKGTIWLDDLKFEPLPPETESYPAPALKVTSQAAGHGAGYLADGSAESYWKSGEAGPQEILVDFTTRREFGGLQIDWLKGHQAASYEIRLSEDGRNWETVHTVNNHKGEKSFIRLAETEARYLKILLRSAASQDGFGICELSFLTVRNSLTPNDFMIYTAQHSQKGNYPRFLLDQASYWTIAGVNNDLKEAMINEDGMVEVDKGLFSIEPVIRSGDSVYTWSNVRTIQSVGDPARPGSFTFLPAVTWQCSDFDFTTTVTATGEANKSSMLQIAYLLKNNASHEKTVDLFLLIRPYQVNPHYQFLNLTGGVGKIRSLKEEDGYISVDDKIVITERKYDAFGAATFDQGNLVEMIRNGKFPEVKSAVDHQSLASGLMKYTLKVKPGGEVKFFVVVPFYGKETAETPLNKNNLEKLTAGSVDFWREKAGHVGFNLPASAQRIIDTYRSNLVYILINRDKAGIQPGSRSYERSWIRDGALTSSALLKAGIVPEVKDFIRWYASHLYENGKVPCVVDFRGPDPVPENDSHGQLIYVIREYFNFTGDTAFLREMNPKVLQAVGYIQSLVAERSTDHFRDANDSVRAYYGLVPESISHEGYSAKPMHSYWDDFFVMKGLKDAVVIQEILGEKEHHDRISKIRDTFRTNLYNSLNLAMKVREIDYIPGCVELGDFDATSTTIALTPCNELNNLPKPQVYNTFEKYYTFFRNRREGKLNWVNYTPYENRLIGSFILLDQPDRAHELIDFFLNDQRPRGFNHWAEVVWKDYRYPGYIGDMPHTWVGSDFLNAIRSMFVYENEYDQSLVLASALYQDWIDAPGGMSVKRFPTYYGELSYEIVKMENSYRFSVSGDLKLPANGMKIRNFNGSKKPSRVTVNGAEMGGYTEKEIPVGVCPAEIMIYY
jgi:hypothetical protein